MTTRRSALKIICGSLTTSLALFIDPMKIFQNNDEHVHFRLECLDGPKNLLARKTSSPFSNAYADNYSGEWGRVNYDVHSINNHFTGINNLIDFYDEKNLNSLRRKLTSNYWFSENRWLNLSNQWEYYASRGFDVYQPLVTSYTTSIYSVVSNKSSIELPGQNAAGNAVSVVRETMLKGVANVWDQLKSRVHNLEQIEKTVAPQSNERLAKISIKSINNSPYEGRTIETAYGVLSVTDEKFLDTDTNKSGNIAKFSMPTGDSGYLLV
jgi:hypothetical protein